METLFSTSSGGWTCTGVFEPQLLEQSEEDGLPKGVQEQGGGMP